MVKVWEGSPEDKTKDRKMAKQLHMTLTRYEHSSQDKADDKKMQKRLDKRNRRAFHAS